MRLPPQFVSRLIDLVLGRMSRLDEYCEADQDGVSSVLAVLETFEEDVVQGSWGAGAEGVDLTVVREMTRRARHAITMEKGHSWNTQSCLVVMSLLRRAVMFRLRQQQQQWAGSSGNTHKITADFVSLALASLESVVADTVFTVQFTVANNIDDFRVKSILGCMASFVGVAFVLCRSNHLQHGSEVNWDDVLTAAKSPFLLLPSHESALEALVNKTLFSDQDNNIPAATQASNRHRAIDILCVVSGRESTMLGKMFLSMETRAH